MATVYFSLGSNLGKRKNNLRKALRLLEECGLKVTNISSIYETQPVSKVKQGYFFNLCIEAKTEFAPEKILQIIKMIEKQMDRSKKKKKKHLYEEPRTIDIDILLYDGEIIDKRNLHIPHKHMLERRFVLEPLAEIAPNKIHPTTKKSVQYLLNACTDNSIVLKRNMLDFK